MMSIMTATSTSPTSATSPPGSAGTRRAIPSRRGFEVPRSAPYNEMCQALRWGFSWRTWLRRDANEPQLPDHTEQRALVFRVESVVLVAVKCRAHSRQARFMLEEGRKGCHSLPGRTTAQPGLPTAYSSYRTTLLN